MIAYNFGKKVYDLRIKLGMSAEELGFLAKIDRNHVRQIERGLKTPKIDTAERVAKGLGMELVDLLNSNPTNNKVDYLDRFRPYLSNDFLDESQIEFLLNHTKEYVRQIETVKRSIQTENDKK